MKISSEKKKTILLETFETLKNNYKDNSKALADLVGKLSKIDVDMAVEMWKYLIKNNQAELHSTDDFSFTFMYAMERVIGNVKTYEIVANDTYLKESIYHESGDLECCPVYAIEYFIQKNQLALVNELLELVYTNQYVEQSFYSILDGVIPEDENITEEAFDLLNEWIKKVENKEERAKLNLKMLSFIDENDE